MSASASRLQAIAAVNGYRAPEALLPAEPPGAVFGQNVFTKAVMQQRLPKPVFASLMSTIDHGKPLDPAVADVVASAMKDWAMEKGATHYAHVFYPLTGSRLRSTTAFSNQVATGRPSRSSLERRYCKANPTHRAFPTAGYARRSKPVAIPAGT
jgi:glutamine synthetase